MPMLRTRALRARFAHGSYRGSSLAGPTQKWQAPGLSEAWIETASQVARGGDPVSAPQLLVLPALAPVPCFPRSLVWPPLVCGSLPTPPQGALLGPGVGCGAWAWGVRGPSCRRGVKRPPPLPPPPILEGRCLSEKPGGRHRW